MIINDIDKKKLKDIINDFDSLLEENDIDTIVDALDEYILDELSLNGDEANDTVFEYEKIRDRIYADNYEN
ncbi:MAG: hypothetical protein K6D38_06735 [Pseudobutyrivibrio sp.]|nr:hypothetical protein [Pseudobutyrivibrio sp.]